MPDGSCHAAPALGAPRLLGGARVATEALARRWAAGDRHAVVSALAALVADGIGRRAGGPRLILSAVIGLQRGELTPSAVRGLLELGDHRRADVRLARQVLAVALADEELHPLHLAGIVPQVLRLHFALSVAPVDEEHRDDGRGPRLILDALRGAEADQ